MVLWRPPNPVALSATKQHPRRYRVSGRTSLFRDFALLRTSSSNEKSRNGAGLREKTLPNGKSLAACPREGMRGFDRRRGLVSQGWTVRAAFSSLSRPARAILSPVCATRAASRRVWPTDNAKAAASYFQIQRRRPGFLACKLGKPPAKAPRRTSSEHNRRIHIHNRHC